MNNSIWLVGSLTEQGTLPGRLSLWARVTPTYTIVTFLGTCLLIVFFFFLNKSLFFFFISLEENSNLLFFVVAVVSFFSNEAKVFLEYGCSPPN